MENARSFLESRQVWIYFTAIFVAAITGFANSHTAMLEPAINPALAFMLFVTFLQVPLSELREAFRHRRFIAALLVANFIVIPIIVALLVGMAPPDPMLRLAMLIVLLTPCIDYVVTFAHLGKGDARLLLASTPLLLLLQMVLLPAYLAILLGGDASALVRPEPFIHAFLWLIATPLLLAGALQFAGRRKKAGRNAIEVLGIFPVAATALVLFLVVAAVTPRIADAGGGALAAAPVYLAYAVIAPLAGWFVARGFGVASPAARAVSFSAGTRNSLVVLPLAFAVPGGVPLLPAVIVTQTMIELVSELVYLRVLPLMGKSRGNG